MKVRNFFTIVLTTIIVSNNDLYAECFDDIQLHDDGKYTFLRVITGEMAVVDFSEGYKIYPRRLIAALRLPFEEGEELILGLIRDRFGLNEVKRYVTDDTAIWEKERQKIIDIEHRKKIKKYLDKNGINFTGIIETIIISDRYNINTNDASSTFVVRVIDGNSLFNVPSTILVLSRIDSGLRWIRGHTIIPLKKKVFSTEKIITNTEVELFDDANLIYGTDYILCSLLYGDEAILFDKENIDTVNELKKYLIDKGSGSTNKGDGGIKKLAVTSL